MQNKQKFIECMLNFDVDTIQPLDKKDKEHDHYYSSYLTQFPLNPL